MDERLSEPSQPRTLNLSISSPSQVSTSVSLTASSGSYTIVNNTFIVAVRLTDSDIPSTVDELLTPITPSNMGSLLTDEEIIPPSEDEPILVTERDIVQDDEYYLSMMNFEFEGVQFLVPQWGFPENSMLNLPLDQETYASTCDGVYAQDFRCLMEFMYPLDSLPLPTRHWASILKLSSIWHMNDYRKQALSSHNFYDLEPEEKLVLGRLSGIPEWYREGCIELARGDSQLNTSHEATIGIDAMVKIARARDAAYRDTVASYHQQFPNLASFAHEVPDSFVPEDNSSSTGSRIIDNVCTARANGFYQWLQCCYEQLIDREESITLEEVETLGLETTIGIWKARLRLFQEYRHILKSTQDLNFTAHVETEFGTELGEVRRLQDIFGAAPKGISMPMHNSFNPGSIYVVINLKFNTVLEASLGSSKGVVGHKYDGLSMQKVGCIRVSSGLYLRMAYKIQWKFQRTDSSYKIVNVSNNLCLSKSKISGQSLVCYEEPSTFLVGRASSDESDIYGIFLSEFPESAATVRMNLGTGNVLLDKWEGVEMEGWKWKIVTADEAKKHFGVV